MHDSRHNSFVALLIGIAGWLVPGAGHLLLRMWMRSLALFAIVAALAATGLALRGRLFTFSTNDFFDLLGFLADCGAGSFFYLALKYNNGGPDVAHAAGDYGTRFFAAAGVLNVLAAVDAYRLARGDEQDAADEDSPSTPGTGSPDSAGHDGDDPASQLQIEPMANPATECAPVTSPATPAESLPPAQEPSRE